MRGHMLYALLHATLIDGPHELQATIGGVNLYIWITSSSITYILPHERGKLIQLSSKVAQLAAVSVED